MRKLLALLILSVSFFLGGTDYSYAEKQMAVASVAVGEQSEYKGDALLLIADGNPGFALAGTETVGAKEVCIGPGEMLDYFREPPNPMISTEPLDILEGAAARDFVFQTGGASVVSFVGFVYFFQAPEERPGQVLAMLADPAGCAILISGKRTVTPGKSAGLVLPTWKVELFLRSLRPDFPATHSQPI